MRRSILLAMFIVRCKSFQFIDFRATKLPHHQIQTSRCASFPRYITDSEAEVSCYLDGGVQSIDVVGFELRRTLIQLNSAAGVLLMTLGASNQANAWDLPVLQKPMNHNSHVSSTNIVGSGSFWVVESTSKSLIKTVPLPRAASDEDSNAAANIPTNAQVNTDQIVKQPSLLPHAPVNSNNHAAKKVESTLSTNFMNLQMSKKDLTIKPPALPKTPAVQAPKQQKRTTDGEFQPIDVKKITDENKIEVELQLKDQSGTVKIDRETFQKIKIVQPKFLQYLPSSMQPLISTQFQSLKVLKEIPDDQLFEASVLAGSLTEIIRSTLTYPLSTVKARVQSRRSMSIGRRRNRTLLRKLKVTCLTFCYETKRGNLFAGILPTLLITIPASGVYSGVKEVSKRAIAMGMQSHFVAAIFTDDSELTAYMKVLSVNLLSVLIADVASLAVRTPADVLALRRQVYGRSNVKSDFTNWAKDSVLLLPFMITTDLPYLMSRIFLNAAITTSGENLGRYEVETIIIACLCAFLTTPFDVARTRILLPTLPSEEETERRIVGSSKYREERRQKLSVLKTMRRISKEGNGGIQNLFAGWLERTVFLGLGKAWLDPIRLIGYLGLRDAILLKFFD